MGRQYTFLYFTDHNAELGRAVTEGRRREFAEFSGFGKIETPDPHAVDTFIASKLRWDELTLEPHLYMLNMYKSLLLLRRKQPDCHWIAPKLQIELLDENTLLLRRTEITAIIRLHGHGAVELPGEVRLGEPLWSSEDPRFAPDSRAIQFDRAESRIAFLRPGALVFKNILD